MHHDHKHRVRVRDLGYRRVSVVTRSAVGAGAALSVIFGVAFMETAVSANPSAPSGKGGGGSAAGGNLPQPGAVAPTATLRPPSTLPTASPTKRPRAAATRKAAAKPTQTHTAHPTPPPPPTPVPTVTTGGS